MATATQVESFCESCGTRYAFEPRRPRGRHLVRVGRMVGILADEADVDSSALVVSRDPFHGAFHFCLECRRFTCPSCWDTSAGFCRSCALATGSEEMAPAEDHAPDPAIEAILQEALATLMLLGTSEEWTRLEPPPAPRAEIWAAPPELVETPSDDLSPMIEAGLAVLGAKALAEAERAEAEAEQRRLAQELRNEEERIVAEQAEQLRVADANEQARLAWEADQYRLAQEAEQARLAAEYEQARLAWEADQHRLAQEAEQSRLAEEARQAMIAQAAVAAVVVDHVRGDAPPPSDAPTELPEPEAVADPIASAPEQLPPPEWTALAASLGPDVDSVEPMIQAPAPVAVIEPAPVAVIEPAPVAVIEPAPVPVAEPVPETPAPIAAVAMAMMHEGGVPEAELPALAVAPSSPMVQAVPELAAPVVAAPLAPVIEATPAPVQAPVTAPIPEPAPWVPPPPPPVMPPYVPPPPPPPVAWQMTAPVDHNPGPWAPPPPGWTPNQMPMAAMSLPPAPRQSRSPFAAAPAAAANKSTVRPCPRCDLPLSGQARFCRRCGLPQT